MKNNYFDNAPMWDPSLVDYTGLPRPFAIVPEHIHKIYTRFTLAKKIPIPFQSSPSFNGIQGVLDLIDKNEKDIPIKSLCTYCGIHIENNENVTRWTLKIPSPDNEQAGDRVFSDNHPLHLECMKQARIFCPYMRSRPETEFEYGKFDKLKQNFINQIKNIKGAPQIL